MWHQPVLQTSQQHQPTTSELSLTSTFPGNTAAWTIPQMMPALLHSDCSQYLLLLMRQCLWTFTGSGVPPLSHANPGAILCYLLAMQCPQSLTSTLPAAACRLLRNVMIIPRPPSPQIPARVQQACQMPHKRQSQKLAQQSCGHAVHKQISRFPKYYHKTCTISPGQLRTLQHLYVPFVLTGSHSSQ